MRGRLTFHDKRPRTCWVVDRGIARSGPEGVSARRVVVRRWVRSEAIAIGSVSCDQLVATGQLT
jgi:hypothetical protein